MRFMELDTGAPRPASVSLVTQWPDVGCFDASDGVAADPGWVRFVEGSWGES